MHTRKSANSMLCPSLMSVFLFSLFPASASAVPFIKDIAGNANDGTEIVITGSGFGTKSVAPPLVWDDFESGLDGSFVATSAAAVGNWDAGSGSDKVRYSSLNPRTGQLSAYHDFNSADYNISLSKNGTFKRLYMDYWLYIDFKERKSRNFKAWRLYGDSDRMQLAWVWLCNASIMPLFHESGLNETSYTGGSYSDQNWYHVQLTFQESDPGAANGTIRHLINNKVHGYDSGAITTRIRDTSFDQIRIGHYWATDPVDDCTEGNSGARIFIDNAYIDTSWARVMLADTADWSSRSRTEMLVPGSWSDDSITAVFNSGTFAPGSTAYVFVLNENDEPSTSGYPVMIGETIVPVVRTRPPDTLTAD